jgi:hypothetical protein
VADWWQQALAGAVGGGAFSALGIKFLDRPNERSRREAREVGTIREVLQEVRADGAAKDERIDQLVERVDKLEDRERHMLTRAAVHEAWDQLAFQALVAHNPHHPPPPPLVIRQGAQDEDCS